MSEFEATIIAVSIAYVIGISVVYYYQAKREKDDHLHPNV